MHMADALISPSVGAVMTAASIGLLGYSIKKVKQDLDEKKIPLMGVMGAFVFAAQMINFTIPATGSSGHIGGGLLLAAVLGPHAAFLTIASVLIIQSLFFADGGLLALGCNIFNMGFFPCFLAYPLIYKAITPRNLSPKTIFWGSVLGVVVALQLGSLSVVLETLASNQTELTFTVFALLMQPIHLAIGIAEGLITAAVLSFIHQANPSMIGDNGKTGMLSFKNAVISLAVIAALTGGCLSLFASEHPDGLEWSIIGVTGNAELSSEGAVHESLAQIQEKTAVLPDYNFSDANEENAQLGTSVSGLIGGAITLFVIAVIAKLLIINRKKASVSSK